MRSTIITISALAAGSLAFPTIQKRDGADWDTNGNIKLTFSKDTVNIGDIGIDALFDAFLGACHESGQCETEKIEAKSQHFTTGTVTDLDISILPDGEYPTWIRNGLHDALRASVKAAAKCTDVTYTNHCDGVTAMAYCPETKTTVNQCEIPKYVGINYQDPSYAGAAPPNMGFNLEAVPESDAAICTGVMTGLGAVAGAVNGVAGGIFALFGLACT